ncbi:MAG: PH domain-containing protein [Actinomycetota bacterium]
MTNNGMTNVEFFRPKTAVFTAYCGYGLLTLAVIQPVVTGDFIDATRSVAVAAFISTLIYLIIHRPSLEIGDEGVVINNPLNRIEIGWQDVLEIETRYSLTFHTKSKSYSAWAALAPGRYHHRTVNPYEVKGLIPNSTKLIRASDSPRTDSGAASYIAKLRWNNFNKSRPRNPIELRNEFTATRAIGFACVALFAIVISVIQL